MNIIDYLRWRGDISFEYSPFNHVDNLILAMMASIRWDGIVNEEPLFIQQACEIFDKKEKDYDVSWLMQKHIELMHHVAGSVRFGNIQLLNYTRDFDPQQEEQFAAVTIKLQPDLYYVAFNGTDGSFVGWKEDFNMSFQETIPSQIAAAEYLEKILSSLNGQFYVGGHSKGGNLAVYSSVKTSYQDKILKVFNNDGPGFLSESFIQTQEYRDIITKTITIIPQSSVFGVLMNSQIPQQVIQSSSKEMFYQHNPYSWEVNVTKFVEEKETTKESEIMKATTDLFLQKIDSQTRMEFVNSVYNLFVTTNITNFEEFSHHKISFTAKMLQELSKYDPETRQILLNTFLAMLRISRDSIVQTMIKKEQNNENTSN